MKIKYIGLLYFLLLMFSCSRQESNNHALKPAQSFLASLDTANYSTIAWLDSTQDFGAVKEGDTVKLSYNFKNTGTTPLYLCKVQTSCGCTVVNFPAKALQPGDKSQLTVTFNTRFHPGFARRLIVVTSNTSNNAAHTLVMQGNVVKQKKR
ncbi:MAG TPA: DUF1573 domain-containing protein [Chitinophagaceae bacterium]|jgi:hypothetical protein|nr:DUF1573 domain-containing protein [Chitinophagaceae bacterium]